MEKDKNIASEVNETINSINFIETVEVSPYFKDRTLKYLFNQQKEEKYSWSWFTPKFQLATLVCIIVLNLLAFTQIKKDAYSKNFNTFKTTYDLQSNSTNTLFN